MSEYGTFEDFYNTFKNWSKKDILRGTYDIAQESIQKENKLKEVREYIEEHYVVKKEGTLYMTEDTKGLLEILDKEVN